MRTWFFLLFFFLLFLTTSAQERKYPRLEVNGYIKNLQGLFFLDQPEFRLNRSGNTIVLDTINNPLLTDNFFHNRLNFRLDLQRKLRLRAALRTRLFYGEVVKVSPDFASTVADANNDYFDLSTIWLRHSSLIGHSVVDRFYLEWISGDWEVRLGRQRINWGVATVWNPNDIFNAYAYTDFDYEERPGSDALRVTRYFGFGNSLELAVRVFDDPEDAIAALLYRFRQGSYDLQLLAGVMQNDWALGGAWAGNIGQAGWKGEFTGFLPIDGEGETAFAAGVEADYTLQSGWYFQAGFLLNTNGSSNRRVAELFDFDLSAKNLYPYRFTTLLRASYPINPILNSGLAVLYSPNQTHPLFLNPTFSVSLAQNWDFDLVGQLVFEEGEEAYGSPVQAVFLRLKYSF